MKKIILSAILALLAFVNGNAQDDVYTNNDTSFGIKAGYSSLSLRVTVEGNSASDDLTGFYIGAFAVIDLSEKFALQPEINFGSYSEDGESSGVLMVPVLVKYKANEQFGLFFGPQLDYLTNEEDSEGLKRLGLGIAIGAAYDISDEIFLDARYSFGLSDRVDGDLDEFEDFSIKARFSYFQVGLGYRF